jgi:osmotically inducible lipoprotein OsmB
MQARRNADAAGEARAAVRFLGRFFMKKLAFVALLGLAAAACTTTEERVGGAAVGAGVGAVAGPPGAIVGGAVGAVTGPSVARTTRRAVR